MRTFGGLDQEEELAVLNAQGEIIAIFSGNEQYQLACRRGTPPGTRPRASLCGTTRQRDQRHEHSKETARRPDMQMYVPNFHS